MNIQLSMKKFASGAMVSSDFGIRIWIEAVGDRLQATGGSALRIRGDS